MAAEISNRTWWLLVLRGVFALLFGVLAFVWPGITLASMVLLFGAYALVNGILALVMAIRAPKGSPGVGGMLILGLLSIVVGVLTAFYPGITALSLVILIGAWAIVTGALEIVAGTKLRRFMSGSWMLVLSGALSILFGVLLLVMPTAGALSLVWLIGAYAILFGILLLTAAIRLKKGELVIAEIAPPRRGRPDRVWRRRGSGGRKGNVGKELDMRKTRIGLRWAVITLATASLFCASTTFVSTWRSPDARPLRLTGKKVVAVFMSRRPAVRRRAEDAMAREISAHGAQGVPSYTVLSDEEIKDKEATKAKLEGLGFSGAVVMRVVGRETEVSYEPGVVWVGPHYRHFWGGYWVWGWGTVWDPGYLREDKIVKVETLVYSFEQDELVWAGVSKTLNPDRIEDFVSDLAKAISDQMEKDGLLARA